MKDTPTVPEPEQPLQKEAVERVVKALGTHLYEFTVNATAESVLGSKAASESIAVTQEMDSFLLTEHEGESNPDAWAEVLKGQLTDTALPGGPLALRLRVRCGGDDQLPDQDDEVERTLRNIAVRVYPTLLLPPDPRMPDLPFGNRPFIAGSLHRDPESNLFQELVLKDKTFAKVYSQETESTGRVGMIYCSTGRGGSVQLWSLAEQILQAAWAEQPSGIAEFADAALRQYRFTEAAHEKRRETR